MERGQYGISPMERGERLSPWGGLPLVYSRLAVRRCATFGFLGFLGFLGFPVSPVSLPTSLTPSVSDLTIRYHYNQSSISHPDFPSVATTSTRRRSPVATRFSPYHFRVDSETG